MAPPGMEDITKQLQGFLGNISNNKKIKKKIEDKRSIGNS
jgi:ATP-dependent protease HslVU (ClpYQ) ATPase subunit